MVEPCSEDQHLLRHVLGPCVSQKAPSNHCSFLENQEAIMGSFRVIKGSYKRQCTAEDDGRSFKDSTYDILCYEKYAVDKSCVNNIYIYIIELPTYVYIYIYPL